MWLLNMSSYRNHFLSYLFEKNNVQNIDFYEINIRASYFKQLLKFYEFVEQLMFVHFPYQTYQTKV